jgi:tetratricopeptide (TPR) repeat protein
VKKQIVLVLLAFFSFCFPAAALDIPSGTYGVADYFDGIYGDDKNADRGAFPLLNIPIAGRAAGLASAFTAVADDASFLESNPAGSARIKRPELAFFHGNWFDGNLAGTLAEGLVFTQRIGGLGIAAGGKWLSTPVVEYDQAGVRLSGAYYSEIAVILNGAYNFSLGPRFSGISVGLNLKGAFRQIPDDEYATSAVMADLGVLSSFNLFKFYQSPDWNVSAGLALKNLGPAGLEALPSQAALGLAYKPLEPLLFSFDLFLPFNMRNVKDSGKPYFAAGLEFAYGGFPSIRGGVQLKTGSLRVAAGSSLLLFGGPAGSSGKTGVFLDLDYSRELRSPDQPQNRLSLGVRLGLGARTGGRAEELYSGGLEAYARGNYQDARRYWEEALELDGRFLPAREALAMLEETLAAGNRVDEFLEINSSQVNSIPSWPGSTIN